MDGRVGDITVTPIEPVLRRRALPCGDRSRHGYSTTSARAYTRPVGGYRPRPSCPNNSGSTGTRCGARWMELFSRRARAGGTGRGSFVAEDVLAYAVEPRTQFSAWIRRHNMEPSGRVLQLKETAAEPQVAAGLRMRAGSRVVLLERLGLADERPVSLSQHFFPVSRLRGIFDALQEAAPSPRR